MNDWKPSQANGAKHTPSQESPIDVRASRLLNAFSIVQFLILAAVNLYLLRVAELDGSWGALAVAIALGPAANVVFAIVSSAAYPIVRLLLPPAATKTYLLRSLVMSAGAIVFDFVFVFAVVQPHGC